ncbi:putative neural-cadherin 2 isoform X2 [Panulirus ornatus]|uniref:putative neural-cadherin 2 isoform X2 n=1 Tax=Panulirus ornatus TaxID=150431 RepID=UPI003A8C60BB
MDPGQIFQIITNSTLLATRLLSGAGGGGPLQFAEPRYCLLLVEDAPPAIRVAQVTATHKDGVSARYSIRAGNRDGLFTIDQRSGLITLAAPLDYELHAKHELVVAAEAGEQTVHTIVHVTVVDVNDNQPYFLEKELQVTVVEEEHAHLPATIAKVVARDPDGVDEEGLVYSVGGDGVDDHSPSDAYFTINPHTGDLLQLRPVDRDPPLGRDTWRVKVQVRDGQRVSPSLAAVSRASRRPRVTQGQHEVDQDSSVGQGTSYRSRDPRMPQEHQYLTSQEPPAEGQYPSVKDPSDTVPGQYYQSSEGKVPRRRTSSSSGDLRELEDLLPQHPILEANEGKAEEQDERRLEEEVVEQHAGRHEEERDVLRGKDDLMSREKVRINPGKTNNDKSLEEQLSSPELPGKEEHFIEMRGRAPERRRRRMRSPHEKDRHVRDVSVGTKQNIKGDRQHSRDGAGRPCSPEISSLPVSGPHLGGRKGEGEAISARSETGGSWSLTRVHSDQHSQEILYASDRGRPSKLKHTMRETPQQRGVDTLVSERDLSILRARERGVDDIINPRENVSTDVNMTRGCHSTSQLAMGGGRPPVTLHQDHNTRQINRFPPSIDPPPGEEGLGQSPPRASSPAAATSAARSERDLLSGWDGMAPEGSGDDGGGGVSEAAINTPKVDKLPVTQLPEDRRYVRRFTPEGGGCWDLSTRPREDLRHQELYAREMRRGRVHVAETVVTVVVKDVNDNAPVFPNVTIYGEVQENGPIDLSACVVWAWDADDQQEGTNARLTYSVEKNVVDERSGQAIFAVNPETGLVRTAVCCLDRETTPEYHIQVVATDGGGLKGTGTVVVRLMDVNDNSPRLTRDLWQVEVDETWGDGIPSNDTLLEISAADSDTSNYFFYRVVEVSGWGWQHFGMRTNGTVGQLFALQTLDYEDPAQRRGFRFMVQVTDRGRGGWSEARHTDTAWVEVQLQDVNDNPPQFHRPQAHITVKEDTAPGTLLIALPATDPDMMNQQRVGYRVVGGWGALSVDNGGGIRLWRALDREAPGGEVGVARVVATDEGHPSLSSTATLTIAVTDVNDCPPRLLPPTILHVTEGAPTSFLGIITATDDDVWALAHGPPFSFSLAPSNPAVVLSTISIKYDANVDSRRGGAEVWTMGPLDREEHRQLTVELVVTDAGELAATQPITIIIDDINDNPMKPAAKTVFLWKTQGGGADAALGRVYVEDPDDWDIQDKTFAWAGPPHPLFTLQPTTGEIFASTQLREGRYELHFSVSDSVWGQKNVAAKVTVVVQHLSLEALAHALPITLTPTTPPAITTGWTPSDGGGGLGTLTEAVKQVLGRAAQAVEIVSVYGLTSDPGTNPPHLRSNVGPTSPPFACVWLSVRQTSGSFMDPVKMHGLLALHLQQLEKTMKLRVTIEDTYTMEGRHGEEASGSSVSTQVDDSFPYSPSSVASLASMALPLQAVDTNLTSLVTPHLTRAQDCPAHTQYGDDSCTSASCLNGGRCIRTDLGNRCVCPGGSWGPRCKVMSRTFSGSGWAWVRPLPSCLPTTISLRLLTHHQHALILYSGPLSSISSHRRHPPMAMMALQLVDGQPQMVLEGARGPVKVQVNATISTGTWHTLHLHLNAQGVTLMVDLCGHGWGSGVTTDAHCIARAPWVDPLVTERWGGSVPLQLGGLAHPYPHAADFGWSNAMVHQALDGCIAHLTVNGEVVDLGEPAHSSGSVGGCRPQEEACKRHLASCGLRGQCVGGLHNPMCDCQPGWAGLQCATPTLPAALGQASFTKISLSLTPDPYDVTLQLRVRVRGNPDGLLLQLAASQPSSAFTLRLRGGVACASVSSGVGQAVQEVCLEGFPLGDGLWHMVRASRHGHNLIILVDDGDGWRQNETLASLLATTNFGDMQAVVAGAPLPIPIDEQDGTTIGGMPEFVGFSLVTVGDDLHDSCIDDVRVSGHPLPLPPSMNTTSWGQVTTFQNLQRSCLAPDACTNTTCLPPLSCQDSWRHATCSCESGQQLVGHRCQDVDECVYQPCLNGGTCHNLMPGYYCACSPAHTGDNCQWAKLSPEPHPLTAPLAIAGLTLAVLIIVVIGILLNLRLQRSRAARGVATRLGGVEGMTGTPLTTLRLGEMEGMAGTPVAALCSGSMSETPVAALHPGSVESVTDTSGIPTSNLHLRGIQQLVTVSETSTHENEAMTNREDMRVSGNNVAQSLDQRCSIAAVTSPSPDSVALEHRVSTPHPVLCMAEKDTATSSSTTENVMQQAVLSPDGSSAQPLPAHDDLRAYAYEGDGSPSGSLSSNGSGLQTESPEDEGLRPLVPEYGEILHLLKSLPDAQNHSKPNTRSLSDLQKSAVEYMSLQPKQTEVNIT